MKSLGRWSFTSVLVSFCSFSLLPSVISLPFSLGFLGIRVISKLDQDVKLQLLRGHGREMFGRHSKDGYFRVPFAQRKNLLYKIFSSFSTKTRTRKCPFVVFLSLKFYYTQHPENTWLSELHVTEEGRNVKILWIIRP